jgi:hypothetical protein
LLQSRHRYEGDGGSAGALRGTITFVAFVCIEGCAAGEGYGNCAEIRDDAGTLLLQRLNGHYDGGTGGSVEVVGGRTYQLTLSFCSGLNAGRLLVAFYIDVTRPI